MTVSGACAPPCSKPSWFCTARPSERPESIPTSARAQRGGDDYMNVPSLDFNLGETIGMLRDTLRDFCAAEIAPRAAEIDRVNEFPADLWKKLGDLGVHGMTVEEEY